MKRIKLAPAQLEEVKRLRESKVSFASIGRQLGIERRAVGREYEEWQKKQEGADLKAVRATVVAEQYRMHLSRIQAIADHLLASLDDPLDNPEEKRSVQERIEKACFTFAPPLLDAYPTIRRSTVLKTDAADEEPENPADVQARERRSQARLRRSNIRQARLLLKALRDHTRVGLLDSWQEAWQLYVQVLSLFRRKAEPIMCTGFETGSLVAYSLSDGGGVPCTERTRLAVTEGVIWAAWRSIAEGKGVSIEATSQDKVNRRSLISFGFPPRSEYIGYADKMTLDSICATLIKSANELKDATKGLDLKTRRDKVRLAYEKLEEELDPLVLASKLVSSRCDLCPV